MKKLEKGDIVFGKHNYGVEDKYIVTRVTPKQAEITGETNKKIFKIPREFDHCTDAIVLTAYSSVSYYHFTEVLSETYENLAKFKIINEFHQNTKFGHVPTEGLDLYVKFIKEFKEKYKTF